MRIPSSLQNTASTVKDISTSLGLLEQPSSVFVVWSWQAEPSVEHDASTFKRVPTDDLSMYLNGYMTSGAELKQSDTYHSYSVAK